MHMRNALLVFTSNGTIKYVYNINRKYAQEDLQARKNAIHLKYGLLCIEFNERTFMERMSVKYRYYISN